MLLPLLVVAVLGAQDVVTPPVPKGIGGTTELYRKGPIPFPRPGQKWLWVEAPNFTIISSASATSSRQIAADLEQLAAALRGVHPRFDAKAAQTRIFLFASRRDSQPYFDLLFNRPQARSTGAFVSHRDGSGTMIVDAGRAVATDRTVYHELMHNILIASGSRLPVWLEEGIAEYFSTAQMRGGVLTVGEPIREHQRAVHDRRQSLISTTELFAADGNSAIVAHPMFYPQSWSIVDWLIRNNRRAFYDFVADVENGMATEEALKKHYSIDGRQLQNLAHRSLGGPVASTRFPLPSTEVNLATASLTEADALNELARFLGQLDTTREDALRYLHRALELEPRHARAKAALGLLRAWEKDFEGAGLHLEEALRLAPRDQVVQLDLAQVLLQNALGAFAGIAELPVDSQTRFRRARQLAEQALQNGGDAALAGAIIGTSYLAEDNVAPGIPFLRRAFAARPGRIDFALNLYAMLLRAGDRREADRFFAENFERAREPQTVLAARAAFVREQLSRVNQLVKAAALEEAILLMREMISITPDPVAKSDLQAHLASLSAISVTNREIRAYNDAVDATNRGDHSGSLILLDNLLETVTDPKITAQARALRELVAKRARGMRSRRRAS